MSDNRPTTKSLRLGRALRETREGLGITLTAAAAQIGIDKGRLSKIENGKTPKPASEAEVSRILGGLGIDNSRYEEIMAVAHGADAEQWIATTLPEQQRMNDALVDFETGAAAITDGALVLIPGLAQHPGYTRAIMSGGTVPRSEINSRVALRMGRSAVIDPSRTDDPARYTALIDEAALRRQVGGPTVMGEQLRYLLKVAAWDNTDIRVIPFGAGWYPGTSGAFSRIEPREADGIPIVYLENRRSGQILHADEDVAEYGETVDSGLRVALSATDTTALIADIIEEMRTRDEHSQSA